MALISWVKTHKLIITLLVVIIYLYLKNNGITPFSQYRTLQNIDYPQALPQAGIGGVAPEFSQSKSIESFDVSSNRVVIQESNISLLVQDVRQTGDQILSYVKDNGGYMVYTSYTRPTESPFASITVRVPTDKLDQTLSYFRNLAVKVTSENLVGTDVTQEYTDIEARLATLRKTQVKFEDILDKAVNVQDILTVQRELINLQDQIDALRGQQQAIEKNAQLSKITIYLSTDELALPYTPDKAFRPGVVFKYAVRSLLDNLRIGAEALIWLAVYSPLIAAVILIYILYRRYRVKRMKAPSN
ncbi:MAG: DUF4349 domain-containing protein [Candidatus Levybacteria bacterium]|nr:DUF4349 domain-containing protein [Candidatus Levybacteria bacterium]